MQVCPVGGGCCPYFENYTVDASILDPQLILSVAGHLTMVFARRVFLFWLMILLTHVVVASF
jgi:hypothetical protein